MSAVATRRRSRVMWTVVAVLLGALLGAGLGVLAVSRAQAPYTSRATLMVTPMTPGGAGGFLDRVPTFAQFGQSDAVLTPAAAALGMSGPDDLRGLVTVSSPQKTILINVEAALPDARRSQEVANTVAKELRTALLSTYGAKVARDESIAVSVVDPAREGTRSETVGGGLGAMVGALLGAGLAMALSEILRALRRRSR